MEGTAIQAFVCIPGLRKTMVRAHRQAWCWQDEYHGLQLADIRRLERETQLALQETMADANENNLDNAEATVNATVNKNSMDNKQYANASNSPQISGSKSLDPVRASERRKDKRSQSPSQMSRHSNRSHNNQLKTAVSKSSIGKIEWKWKLMVLNIP